MHDIHNVSEFNVFSSVQWMATWHTHTQPIALNFRLPPPHCTTLLRFRLNLGANLTNTSSGCCCCCRDSTTQQISLTHPSWQKGAKGAGRMKKKKKKKSLACSSWNKSSTLSIWVSLKTAVFGGVQRLKKEKHCEMNAAKKKIWAENETVHIVPICRVLLLLLLLSTPSVDLPLLNLNYKSTPKRRLKSSSSSWKQQNRLTLPNNWQHRTTKTDWLDWTEQDTNLVDRFAWQLSQLFLSFLSIFIQPSSANILSISRLLEYKTHRQLKVQQKSAPFATQKVKTMDSSVKRSWNSSYSKTAHSTP